MNNGPNSTHDLDWGIAGTVNTSQHEHAGVKE